MLATAGGANITIEGGNITVMCPGKITVRASQKSFVGPESASYGMGELPKDGSFQRRFEVRRATDQQPVPNQRYRMTLEDGRVLEGVTDASGQTQVAQSAGMQMAKLELLYD